MSKPHLTNAKRAKLFAIRDEHGMAVLSSVIVTDVMVEAVGNFQLFLDSEIPVFWLPRAERIAVAGSADWDATIKLVGYALIGISRDDWDTPTVLACLQSVFPNIQVAAAEDAPT